MLNWAVSSSDGTTIPNPKLAGVEQAHADSAHRDPLLRHAKHHPLKSTLALRNKSPARTFPSVALGGLVMETEHTETAVGKAVAYVKDILGMPAADRPPEILTKPEYTDTELTSDEAMPLDPRGDAFEKIVERSRRTFIDAEHDNIAARAHIQGAEQVDRAKNVGEALGEIGSYNDVAEHGGKMTSESGNQEADERARDADSKETRRQSEEQSYWRSAL